LPVTRRSRDLQNEWETQRETVGRAPPMIISSRTPEGVPHRCPVWGGTPRGTPRGTGTFTREAPVHLFALPPCPTCASAALACEVSDDTTAMRSPLRGLPDPPRGLWLRRIRLVVRTGLGE